MPQIRLAVPADLHGILEVGRVTWPATYEPLVGEQYVRKALDSWWTEQGTMAAILDERVWVSTDDEGTVQGLAMYGLRDRTVDIWKLYVRPERQGEGIGRALMNRVIAATRDTADRVTLAYMHGNEAARTFYEHMGFVETHRECDKLGGPDNVWMVLT